MLYTQAEIVVVIEARNAAAAQQLAKIANNTKAALDALVIYIIFKFVNLLTETSNETTKFFLLFISYC